MKWSILLAGCLFLLSGIVAAALNSPEWPVPSVRDQINHTKGNIGVATVNFGVLGDVYGNGMPSGRWPANSDRDYLAEIRYWVGAVNSDGDTVLANPADDYNPIQMIGSAVSGYGFLNSIDTTTYDFNETDTVGLGIGYPAYGWRTYYPDSRIWDYNDVYNVFLSAYEPGGPVAVQESICRFGDDASGHSIMGLEVTQIMRQWNYKHIKDVILVTLLLTNSSATDLTDGAFGLYCDFDIGGPDEATGENGRLGDLVTCDTTEDLAWTYDEDGYDPGWGLSVRTGMMGTVLLNTPDDLGMTAFYTDQWELSPTTDKERYEAIAYDSVYTTLPPTDQFYVQGISGFTIPAGETVEVTFAIVAGQTEEKLREAAAAAKTLYDNNMISEQPPKLSTLNAAPGDQMVALSWNNTAEQSVDPATNSTDFRGYKIFKSSDKGQSWGFLTGSYDDPEYIPLARFELNALGRIEHTYSEENLTNGVEYWYALVPYDSSGLEDIFSAQTPDNSVNIVRVFPRSNPLGYIVPEETIEIEADDTWKALGDSVTVMVVDESQVTGDEYKITFSEDCYSRYWHVVDNTTGDTVLSDQTMFTGDAGMFPVFDGVQVSLNYPLSPESLYISQAGPTSDSTVEFYDFGAFYACYEEFRNDFEVHFSATGSVAYEFFMYNYYDVVQPVTVPFIVWNTRTNEQVDCWIADFSLDGEWTPDDYDAIIVTSYPYENGTFHEETWLDYFVWLMQFEPTAVPVEGDVLRIAGVRQPAPDDEIYFDSYKINTAQAKADFDKIHVVPNPYIGRASWETGNGLRKIQFVNLPSACTIRVYTLAGELIRQIEHTNGTGTQDWDMLSESNKSIAAGVYLFNVESELGNYNGKFAVIK
ncbi:MAG: T9SS type A sorting domain-containing protein [Candidatus Zixiibacteriota bacterium]